MVTSVRAAKHPQTSAKASPSPVAQKKFSPVHTDGCISNIYYYKNWIFLSKSL